MNPYKHYINNKTTTTSSYHHDGTLKWNSHEITNAKTIEASKKLRNRCPCQKLRVSGATVGAVVRDGVEPFVSLHWSTGSASGPATFRAIDPQISHVLDLKIV